MTFTLLTNMLFLQQRSFYYDGNWLDVGSRDDDGADQDRIRTDQAAQLPFGCRFS